MSSFSDAYEQAALWPTPRDKPKDEPKDDEDEDDPKDDEDEDEDEDVVPEEVMEELVTFAKALPKLPGIVIDERYLTRWYFGRGEDLERTKKGIRRHLAWRIEHAVDEIKAEDVAQHVSQMKVLVGGPCKQNLPVLFVVVRRHMYKEVDHPSMPKFMIYVLEEMLKLCGQGEQAFSIVFDLRGFSVSDNLDTKSLFDFVKLLTYQYPNVVHQVYISNAPWLFGAIFATMIKPFLPAAACELIHFLSSPEELEIYVSADNCPSDIFEDDEEEEDEEEEEEEEESSDEGSEELEEVVDENN